MDVIIGAGVTGLSYAAFCGHTDYIILEKTDSIGGYCKTTIRNGFVWDYSGHFFHFQNEVIKNFIMSRLDATDLLEVIKLTHIKYKDLLVDYPFQMNIHQLEKSEFIDCLYDLFDIENDKYDNFKDMLFCKFGKSIANKFLIPYNTKLYACNLNTLDKDAMGRFFPYAEKKEIIKNFKATRATSYNGAFVYPKGGAIEYIKSIAQAVDSTKIKLNITIQQISLSTKTIILSDGSTIAYDNLISTIPFPSFLELTGVFYDKNVYTYNQVLVFNMGFDSNNSELHSHWIYFPEEQYSFYRVGFYNNILGSNKMSLYVELGFNKDEDIKPQAWLQRVVNDLKLAGIITQQQKLIDYESIIMNPAYVHINQRATADIKDKKQYLASQNAYSIGRYGSWTYCSIEDNIIEAKQLANKLSK